jgi:hypothetical protein
MQHGIIKAQGTIRNDPERKKWRKFPRKWSKCATTVRGENSRDFGENYSSNTRAKAPIEFVESGPMRPLCRSREARMTAAVCTNDDEEDDTGQLSPFLLLLIPLNYFWQKIHCAYATIQILPPIGSGDRSGEL